MRHGAQANVVLQRGAQALRRSGEATSPARVPVVRPRCLTHWPVRARPRLTVCKLQAQSLLALNAVDVTALSPIPRSPSHHHLAGNPAPPDGIKATVAVDVGCNARIRTGAGT